jgi:uncharacterized protein YjbI with pentapeptide repeats
MNGATLDNAIITGADFSNAQICYDTNEAIKHAFAHPTSLLFTQQLPEILIMN